MKQIFVGSSQRQKLFSAIKKTTRPTHIVHALIWLLLIVVPYILSDSIFGSTNNDYSAVVLVETDSGTGSAVFIGNNYLITAAHVVDNMGLNDYCKIEFQDPNNPDRQPIRAMAQMMTIGEISSKYDPSQDFALLHIVTIDGSNFAKPCLIGSSAAVKVKDKIKVVGFPGGTYSYTEGVVSSIKGGENSDLFDVSAGAWPGNSGGALFNQNDQLIGIVTLKGQHSINEGKTYALKIDKIKQELLSKGFQL